MRLIPKPPADLDVRAGLKRLRRLDRLAYTVELPAAAVLAWFAAVTGQRQPLLVAFGVGMFTIASSIFARGVMRQLEAVIAADEAK